jgi:phasin
MATSPKKAAQAPAAALEQPQVLLPEVEAQAAPEALKAETVQAVEAPVAAAKEIGESVRALVEKGLVETRSRYAQVKTVAEETSAAVEASYGAARNGVVAFNVKTLEALKADAEANFDLFKSLAAAKSVSELVTLQTEFARKRFEDATSRSKELAELARKVADEAVAPFKAHVAKTFKVAV